MAKKSSKKAKSGSPSNDNATRGGSLPSAVQFHYIKSNHFRVIHVDGAHGGITPTGLIQVAFHNDRLPIPQQIVSTVSEDGGLGEEIIDQRVVREGIVREVEVEAIMNLSTAKALRKWLDQRIGDLEKIMEEK